MKKTLKKSLALLLAMIMLLSVTAITASAEGEAAVDLISLDSQTADVSFQSFGETVLGVFRWIGTTLAYLATTFSYLGILLYEKMIER